MNTSGYKTPNKRNASAPRYLLNLPTTLPPALAVPGAHVDDVARALGSEVSGLQLHELNDEQIKALERLIAERGVIFFRCVVGIRETCETHP